MHCIFHAFLFVYLKLEGEQLKVLNDRISISGGTVLELFVPKNDKAKKWVREQFLEYLTNWVENENPDKLVFDRENNLTSPTSCALELLLLWHIDLEFDSHIRQVAGDSFTFKQDPLKNEEEEATHEYVYCLGRYKS